MILRGQRQNARERLRHGREAAYLPDPFRSMIAIIVDQPLHAHLALVAMHNDCIKKMHS